MPTPKPHEFVVVLYANSTTNEPFCYESFSSKCGIHSLDPANPPYNFSSRDVQNMLVYLEKLKEWPSCDARTAFVNGRGAGEVGRLEWKLLVSKFWKEGGFEKTITELFTSRRLAPAQLMAAAMTRETPSLLDVYGLISPIIARELFGPGQGMIVKGQPLRDFIKAVAGNTWQTMTKKVNRIIKRKDEVAKEIKADIDR